MEFSIPHNWQADLVPQIAKPGVTELYSKLARDFVGGGRASCILPHISKNRTAKFISEAHSNGIKFNYLLNATCLGNREWSIKGQRRLVMLLDWLLEIGVDTVTVSIPYLLELIKKRYPGLEVCISTQAGVDSINRAKYWEDLGADKITLAEISVNRNFPLLRQIRQAVKCKLQLIANLFCLYQCPFWLYHSALSSHGSQDDYSFFIDYCTLTCNYKRLKNPIEFIRAGWIRPEDVHYYEAIGIDSIKLVNRTMTTEAIILIVDAYIKGSYDGNLLDLFSRPSNNLVFNSPAILHKFRYFFHPFRVNIFALLKARKLLEEVKVHIDNRSLDGFIGHFLNDNCSLKSCKDCAYCSETAKKSVKIDFGRNSTVISKYRDYLDSLLDGRMFSYAHSFLNKRA